MYDIPFCCGLVRTSCPLGVYMSVVSVTCHNKSGSGTRYVKLVTCLVSGLIWGFFWFLALKSKGEFLNLNRDLDIYLLI